MFALALATAMTLFPAQDGVEVEEVDLDAIDEPAAYNPDPESDGSTIVEEIDVDALDERLPLPEYVRARWLVALPAVCGLVLAVNVNWRRKKRRSPRVRHERPT